MNDLSRVSTKRDVPAIYGESTAGGQGVVGKSSYQGVYGYSSLNSGVVGESDSMHAIFGITHSTRFAGVFGASDKGGTGVAGWSGFGCGILGQSDVSFGVSGQSNYNHGVMGTTSSSATSVAGVFATGNVGLIANGFVYAGIFYGDVVVNGRLTVTGDLLKAGGGFKIDHPLDPANKYLCHSFIESPNRTNIYDGTCILDSEGDAIISLPEWFDQLNETFRYQLTALGRPAPNLHVSAKIKDNKFRVSGGNPGMEVCWQVSGIRKDQWAKSNPLLVEADKHDRETKA